MVGSRSLWSCWLLLRWHGRGGFVWLAVLALLAGCARPGPPSVPDDACAIFREYREWYADTSAVYRRWGVPVHVQLAIVHQESRFDSEARPPQGKLFWFIPWGRASSAFGYAQAIDATWDRYRSDTGNRWASRDQFADAVDFIGWYCDVSHRELGIAKDDAYGQYLAYHEGHQGFRKRSYRKKSWLMSVARKVQALAARYKGQLQNCERKLDPPTGGRAN